MFGIDIGTTQCKMAMVDPAGKPCIISNARGEQTTRSAIYLPESGDPLVGTDAVEQGYVDPERFVSNFKLDLGSTKSLLNHGLEITPTKATAILIAALVRDAERATGTKIEEAVFTCPANFRDDAKQALLEACQRCGIKVLQLMHEPSAAGYAYALHKTGQRARILVYDFGGGTFDVSVIEVDGAQVSVLATEGVAKLGGNDLSDCLKNRVLEEVETICGERPSPKSDPLFYLDLSQRVESAKISLGTQKQVPIVVGHKGKQVIVKISQDEFHLAIDPLVRQSLDAMDKAVASARLTMAQIDRLLMAGGTSRLPYIQNRVADHTGLVPRTDIDPDKAIAYGAALAAITEIARQGRTASLRGQTIPAPEAFVRDVTAHGVGCAAVNNGAGHKQLLNAVIIPKNTPIPCQRTDRFYLEQEDQTIANIEILQGEANADREDCLLIGELKLKDLPTETKRSERIEVEYVIDANGMVNATVTDKVSGKQQTVSVDYKQGIRAKNKPSTV